MSSVHFVYVADVFCPWCYAFAPIMQRIAKEHPELPLSVVGGNLISRPLTLEEDARQSPGLADFWREVERVSGRSLAGAINAVETGKNVRLYSPGADEILAVLKLMAPGHELEQLLELEDMFYGQGLDIFSDDSLAAIAKNWGISTKRLESALDQPAAQAATEKNLERASRLMGEINAYPSLLLVRGDNVLAVSRGYVQYETAAARLADAMRDLGLPEEESPRCSRHGKCSLGRG